MLSDPDAFQRCGQWRTFAQQRFTPADFDLGRLLSDIFGAFFGDWLPR